ncbi:centrosomal protein 148 kDa [Heterostelium album PN500]|uniref:Centrosomal protein 148 kDa n=1 Tax=Heterostelium pallidum (strain ATCC 26659 / Pp 5 / PN500) TaxID=670386 RepID=D3B5V2_HETP5|nr:centrosomal protein 148 kDa [Heterostelium album PN500]EFA83250.1 centrosomal protein 148 kDa [Heterostelium album PN500]|eukprot:XP_020435367.1 centrosomal protein 148 kDa [Heterostelium album PN500]
MLPNNNYYTPYQNQKFNNSSSSNNRTYNSSNTDTTTGVTNENNIMSGNTRAGLVSDSGIDNIPLTPIRSQNNNGSISSNTGTGATQQQQQQQQQNQKHQQQQQHHYQQQQQTTVTSNTTTTTGSSRAQSSPNLYDRMLSSHNNSNQSSNRSSLHNMSQPNIPGQVILEEVISDEEDTSYPQTPFSRYSSSQHSSPSQKQQQQQQQSSSSFIDDDSPLTPSKFKTTKTPRRWRLVPAHCTCIIHDTEDGQQHQQHDINCNTQQQQQQQQQQNKTNTTTPTSTSTNNNIHSTTSTTNYTPSTPISGSKPPIMTPNHHLMNSQQQQQQQQQRMNYDTPTSAANNSNSNISPSRYQSQPQQQYQHHYNQQQQQTFSTPSSTSFSSRTSSSPRKRPDYNVYSSGNYAQELNLLKKESKSLEDDFNNSQISQPYFTPVSTASQYHHQQQQQQQPTSRFFNSSTTTPSNYQMMNFSEYDVEYNDRPDNNSNNRSREMLEQEILGTQETVADKIDQLKQKLVMAEHALTSAESRYNTIEDESRRTGRVNVELLGRVNQLTAERDKLANAMHSNLDNSNLINENNKLRRVIDDQERIIAEKSVDDALISDLVQEISQLSSVIDQKLLEADQKDAYIRERREEIVMLGERLRNMQEDHSNQSKVELLLHELVALRQQSEELDRFANAKINQERNKSQQSDVQRRHAETKLQQLAIEMSELKRTNEMLQGSDREERERRVISENQVVLLRETIDRMTKNELSVKEELAQSKKECQSQSEELQRSQGTIEELNRMLEHLMAENDDMKERLSKVHVVIENSPRVQLSDQQIQVLTPSRVRRTTFDSLYQSLYKSTSAVPTGNNHHSNTNSSATASATATTSLSSSYSSTYRPFSYTHQHQQPPVFSSSSSNKNTQNNNSSSSNNNIFGTNSFFDKYREMDDENGDDEDIIVNNNQKELTQEELAQTLTSNSSGINTDSGEMHEELNEEEEEEEVEEEEVEYEEQGEDEEQQVSRLNEGSDQEDDITSKESQLNNYHTNDIEDDGESDILDNDYDGLEFEDEKVDVEQHASNSVFDQTHNMLNDLELEDDPVDMFMVASPSTDNTKQSILTKSKENHKTAPPPNVVERKKLNLRVNSGELCVRVGGGYEKLEDFVNKGNQNIKWQKDGKSISQNEYDIHIDIHT